MKCDYVRGENEMIKNQENFERRLALLERDRCGLLKDVADINELLLKINSRLSSLELKRKEPEPEPELETVEMELILPEADIDGLHFNETKVHALFDKKDGGWFHSRDILFLSARNTEDDNSRDILMKYLQWDISIKYATLRQQIAAHFGVAVINVEISLPKENEDRKQYNGVDWWYWMAEKYSDSAFYFCYVNYAGNSDNNGASAVGGCAPIFRIAN
jgi:hypothetical protein